MADEYPRVESLGQFTDKLRELRKVWGLPKHKELWFRGETMDYGNTILRPELYRPCKRDASLKPIWKLLSIENDLHDEFMRNAVEHQSSTDDDWAWDSYFLLQHHEGPTRLLDWSDGALMAMHFALRDRKHDGDNARVYVLEAYRLAERLKQSPDAKTAADTWKSYVAEHPGDDLDADAWDELYLPSSDEERQKAMLPRPPLVLDFPHITRRIAAQRSRFVVFGTEPAWLADELKSADSTIRVIIIPHECRASIRQELRDCGVTESVIYPDLDGLGREMKQLWEDRRLAPEENA
jgi:hypothetical protein